MEWYARARRVALDIDATYGGGVERAAAVIAVLSPRLSWSHNVRLAWQAYAQGEDWHKLPCLTASSDKAYALVTGEAPDTVVSGPKVTAFWRTICDPAGSHTAVVDRHAISVALGRNVGDAEMGRWNRGKGYAAVAECYVRAARILSRETGQHLTASDVQAITWTYWRRARSQKRTIAAADWSDPILSSVF
jgi:hypothetical protein